VEPGTENDGRKWSRPFPRCVAPNRRQLTGQGGVVGLAHEDEVVAFVADDHRRTLADALVAATNRMSRASVRYER
jgi:hypothetical protein